MIDVGVHTNTQSNIIVVTAEREPNASISYRCVVKDTIDVCLIWAPEIVNLLERSVHFIHSKHTWYLSHRQNFWKIKFTPKKRVNYDKIHRKLPIFLHNYGKIHSKLPIFRVKSIKIYTGQKKLHEYIRGVRDKYQVWLQWTYTYCLFCILLWELTYKMDEKTPYSKVLGTKNSLSKTYLQFNDNIKIQHSWFLD